MIILFVMQMLVFIFVMHSPSIDMNGYYEISIIHM